MNTDRENVLFSQIWEKLIANDWALMGKHMKMHSRIETRVLADAPTKNKALNAPMNFTELFRYLYHKFIRRIPLMTHMGDAYLDKLDKLAGDAYDSFDKLYVESAFSLDVLAALKYYTSYWYFVVREDVYNVRSTTAPAKDFTFSRYWQPKAYSLRRNIESQNKDEQRMQNFKSFKDAWRRAARCIVNSQKDILKRNIDWWTIIEENPDLGSSNDLKLKDLMKSVLSAFAQTILHLMDLLDDSSWVKTFRIILKLIPTSLIVMSLKVVNPAPFVDQFVKIFLWQPKAGVWSLMQRIVGILCGVDKAKSVKERMEKSASKQDKAIVEAILNNDDSLASFYDDQMLMKALEKGGVSDSARLVTLLRASIAHKEKVSFVDQLGNKAVYNLLVHICQFMAKFLNEVKHVMSVSEFVDRGFVFTEGLIDHLSIYEEMNSGNQEHLRREMLSGLFKDGYEFLKYAHPILHKAAKYRRENHKKTPRMLTDMADFIVTYFFHLDFGVGYKGRINAMKTYHASILQTVQSFDEEKMRLLCSEIDGVVISCNKQIDEAKWSKTRIIDQDIMPKAYELALQTIANF